MAVIKGLEWTFDTAAEVYEKMRPGYVEELYRDIPVISSILLLPFTGYRKKQDIGRYSKC